MCHICRDLSVRILRIITVHSKRRHKKTKTSPGFLLLEFSQIKTCHKTKFSQIPCSLELQYQCSKSHHKSLQIQDSRKMLYINMYVKGGLPRGFGTRKGKTRQQRYKNDRNMGTKALVNREHRKSKFYLQWEGL